MSKYVNSKVVINKSMVKQLQEASIMALERTGDYVLGEAIDKQVIPFGDSFERGGNTHQGGTLQESGHVDKSQAKKGNVAVVFSTPYARRLYFHPEYNFRHVDNANAKGQWLEDWAEGGKYEEEVKQFFAYRFKLYGGI